MVNGGCATYLRKQPLLDSEFLELARVCDALEVRPRDTLLHDRMGIEEVLLPLEVPSEAVLENVMVPLSCDVADEGLFRAAELTLQPFTNGPRKIEIFQITFF